MQDDARIDREDVSADACMQKKESHRVQEGICEAHLVDHLAA